jgi:hypothetical protein
VSFGPDRIESGKKIRCPGCRRLGRVGHIICGVPPKTVGAARTIPSEAAAAPGSGVFYCKACETWTEIAFAPARATVAA